MPTQGLTESQDSAWRDLTERLSRQMTLPNADRPNAMNDMARIASNLYVDLKSTGREIVFDKQLIKNRRLSDGADIRVGDLEFFKIYHAIEALINGITRQVVGPAQQASDSAS